MDAANVMQSYLNYKLAERDRALTQTEAAMKGGITPAGMAGMPGEGRVPQSAYETAYSSTPTMRAAAERARVSSDPSLSDEEKFRKIGVIDAAYGVGGQGGTGSIYGMLGRMATTNARVGYQDLRDIQTRELFFMKQGVEPTLAREMALQGHFADKGAVSDEEKAAIRAALPPVGTSPAAGPVATPTGPATPPAGPLPRTKAEIDRIKAETANLQARTEIYRTTEKTLAQKLDLQLQGMALSNEDKRALKPLRDALLKVALSKNEEQHLGLLKTAADTLAVIQKRKETAAIMAQPGKPAPAAPALDAIEKDVTGFLQEMERTQAGQGTGGLTSDTYLRQYASPGG